MRGDEKRSEVGDRPRDVASGAEFLQARVRDEGLADDLRHMCFTSVSHNVVRRR
jgi:hypothetical protein